MTTKRAKATADPYGMTTKRAKATARTKATADPLLGEQKSGGNGEKCERESCDGGCAGTGDYDACC